MIPVRLEFTTKALIIGMVLSIVFCGANIYLGLKIGSTISASIPSAVLAMVFLRMFKKYSCLENSISQTTASVGESLATAIIFVFPALIILHVWDSFHYVNILISISTGATIGVVYSIILRKILLDNKQLSFPEGQAIGKILQATEKSEVEGGGKFLVGGMLVSSITSFCQVGLQIFTGGITKIFVVGNKLVGGGVSFSVAIMGAGFLIGFMPMFVAFLSLIFAWCVLLPIFSSIHGIKDSNDILGSAFFIWKNYIRPIGVGTFIFAGFATISTLVGPIMRGLKESATAIKKITSHDLKEKDLNVNKLLLLVLIMCVPIIIVLLEQFSKLNNYGFTINLIFAIIVILVLLIIGFAIAAVSGYFAGLTGSTASPVSGLLFIAVIVVTLLLLFVCDRSLPNAKKYMLETIIFLIGFIAGLSVITNGSIQDFKSGQMVGSTPYKQQLALFIGVLLSAFVAPLFMSLIFNAYGIAGVVSHVGMNPHNTLSAPQASAVAALTSNILGGSQDWSLILYGMMIAAFTMILDYIGNKTGKYRCSMVSVGIGIYLPPDIITAIFIGGCMRLIVDRRQIKIANQGFKNEKVKLQDKVNLLVCGLIAGESLMGLILAIPFVIYQSSDALKIVSSDFRSVSSLLSVIVTLLVLYFTYRTGTKMKLDKKS